VRQLFSENNVNPKVQGFTRKASFFFEKLRQTATMAARSVAPGKAPATDEWPSARLLRAYRPLFDRIELSHLTQKAGWRTGSP